MSLGVDTGGLVGAAPTTLWRGDVRQPLLRHAPAFRDAEGLHGKQGAFYVGSTTFISATAVGYDVTRGSAEIDPSAEDVVVLMRQRSGARLFSQNGRDARLSPGDSLLIDSATPMRSEMLSAGNLQCIVMPRAAMARRLDRMEDLVARPLSGASQAGSLLNDYTEMVLRQAATQDDRCGRWMEKGFHDLVAMVFGGAVEPARTGDGSLKSMRLDAMLRQIDKHYRDPALSPRIVAAHAGVSERYLHRLFKTSSRSFRQSVVHRRLAEARQCLGDLREVHRSIADIAFAVGFADLSGFNRTFKEAFGMTPREMRGQMLLALDRPDGRAGD